MLVNVRWCESEWTLVEKCIKLDNLFIVIKVTNLNINSILFNMQILIDIIEMKKKHQQNYKRIIFQVKFQTIARSRNSFRISVCHYVLRWTWNPGLSLNLVNSSRCGSRSNSSSLFNCNGIWKRFCFSTLVLEFQALLVEVA